MKSQFNSKKEGMDRSNDANACDTRRQIEATAKS